MNPTLLGLLWYFPAVLLLTAIGFYVFDKEKRFGPKNAIKGVIECRGYLAVMALVFLAIKAENILQDMNVWPNDYTHLIYNIEGNGIIVWLQGLTQHPAFLHPVSIFYVLFFMWLILFSATFFITTRRKKLVRRLVYSIALNYAILVPLYLFFNVSVSCYYPENTAVQPLLYQNDMYHGIVLLVDRLNDNFPSGHISVSVSITLLLFLKTKMRDFAWFALMTTIATGFVILYLGIHWITDIAFGVLLGYWAYWAGGYPPIAKRLDKMVVWFEDKIPAPDIDFDSEK